MREPENILLSKKSQVEKSVVGIALLLHFFRITFESDTDGAGGAMPKYYCFNHSRASRIRTFFLPANHGGQQYFSVFHGLPHFEIHFAGPSLI